MGAQTRPSDETERPHGRGSPVLDARSPAVKAAPGRQKDANPPARSLGFLSYVRWLPQREVDVIEEIGLHGRPWGLLIGQAALMGIFAFPAVQRATGVRLGQVAVAWVLFAAGCVGSNVLCYPRAHRKAWAFYGLVFGAATTGATFSLALPVLSGDPQSPLWMAFAIMSCVLGAQEGQASVAMGVFLFVAPLLTVPLFLDRGAALPWAWVSPLICSIASSYGYWFQARRRAVWRWERHRLELAKAERRLADSEAERLQLTRDLHDSVGTALSLVALYSSLAEHRAHDPSESARLAGNIRQAARAAVEDLRGILYALPQAPATVGALAESLTMVGLRSTQGTGTKLAVRVLEGEDVVVRGPLRTAFVRISQEAVHNALRHGRATQITVALQASQGWIALEVADNGTGFVTGQEGPGTGLRGMSSRAAEAGGTLRIDSLPGSGSRIQIRLPIDEPTTG